MKHLKEASDAAKKIFDEYEKIRTDIYQKKK